MRRPPRSTLFPTTALSRSGDQPPVRPRHLQEPPQVLAVGGGRRFFGDVPLPHAQPPDVSREESRDRKSTRLNSSHANISYAVFCLKKNIRQPARTVHCLVS